MFFTCNFLTTNRIWTVDIDDVDDEYMDIIDDDYSNVSRRESICF
jgi:hypothetical protein